MPVTKLKTELGFKITVLKSHKIAEEIARLKEDIEDHTTSANRLIDKLLDQMREDKLTTLTSKAPGGTLYYFEVENRGQRIKISKPR